MSDSNESLVSDHEFRLLIDSLRELRENLELLVELVTPWLDFAGVDIPQLQHLLRLEIVELVGVVSDIDCCEDDVLASFLLFLLQADLSDDYLTLRRELEGASQPGMTEVFLPDDEEEHFLSWESRLQRLTTPSVFMETTVVQLDRVLAHHDLKTQFIDLYLGAFAKFAFSTFRSTVLSNENAASLVRAGWFCTARLQLRDLISESSLEFEPLEHFEFDSSHIDTFKAMQDCLMFSARFNGELIDAYSNLLSSVIEVLEANKDIGRLSDAEIETYEEKGSSSIGDAKSRLGELEELYDSGLISLAEYTQQRQRIIEGI